MQSEAAITWIRLMLSGIPVLGLSIALIVLLRLHLTEARMAEIRALLEARRGSV